MPGWRNGHYPVIGHIVPILKAVIHQKKNNLNNHIIDVIINLYSDGERPVLYGFFTCGVGLGIMDPSVVEAMYTTKNKYFSKHPLIKDLTLCLLGKSILFAETSSEWREARKTMSPAFYKGKLVSLVEIARESVRHSVDRLKNLVRDSKTPRTEINLITEISDIFVRILLMCALGEDVS